MTCTAKIIRLTKVHLVTTNLFIRLSFGIAEIFFLFRFYLITTCLDSEGPDPSLYRLPEL